MAWPSRYVPSSLPSRLTRDLIQRAPFFDHRVIDGFAINRPLAATKVTLGREIAAELEAGR
jgi:hypothetical protein